MRGERAGSAFAARLAAVGERPPIHSRSPQRSWARSTRVQNQRRGKSAVAGIQGFPKEKTLGSGIPGGRVSLCNRMKFLGQEPDPECGSRRGREERGAKEKGMRDRPLERKELPFRNLTCSAAAWYVLILV